MASDQLTIEVDVETTEDFDTMITDIEEKRITDHDPCPHCNRCPHCGGRRYFTPAIGRKFY